MATTANYGLHQWEPSDNFLRTDFNSDFSKIDTAIKAAKTTAEQGTAAVRSELAQVNTGLQHAVAQKSVVYAGSYSGDNASSRKITLGARPKAVLLTTDRGITAVAHGTFGGLAVQGSALCTESSGHTALSLDNDGFTAHYRYDTNGSALCNASGQYYNYVAFC